MAKIPVPSIASRAGTMIAPQPGRAGGAAPRSLLTSKLIFALLLAKILNNSLQLFLSKSSTSSSMSPRVKFVSPGILEGLGLPPAIIEMN